MPDASCCCTTSATAPRTRWLNAASSTGWRLAFAASISLRSGGRGRLPACVDRMRSVLRFTAALLTPPGAGQLLRRVAAETADGVVHEARVHHAVEVHLGGLLTPAHVPALRLAQAIHVHHAVRVRPGRPQPLEQRDVV